MCSQSVDCRTCSIIETCPIVRAAFPTQAEESAAKRKAPGGIVSSTRDHWKRQGSGKRPKAKVVNGVKMCATCGKQPRVNGCYCRACANLRWRAFYAKNAPALCAQKRARYVKAAR